MSKRLPYRATTASGNQFEFELPLHPAISLRTSRVACTEPGPEEYSRSNQPAGLVT